MIRFYLDNESELLWFHDYKEEVAGDEFEEMFVVTGNRDYIGCTNASWYEKAKEVLGDMELVDYPGSAFNEWHKEFTREQRKALLKVYEECRYTDDLETIVKAANIIYPEREFRTATIRGYCQGDWQEVAYDATVEDSLDYLEAWYFGKITEIHCIDDEEMDVWSTATNDEIWKWEREDRLAKELLLMFGYDENEECEIYENDGYIKTRKWKQVM